MSTFKAQVSELVSDNLDQTAASRSFFASLKNHALAGAAAFLLLSIIETIDLNIRLTLESFSDRLLLFAYASVNILAGIIIGLTAGLFLNLASLLSGLFQKIPVKAKFLRLAQPAVGLIGVSALTALLVNQHPTVNRYIIGLIREAEKFSFIRNTLLSHERATSYLILTALALGCLLTAKIARSSEMSRWLRIAWLSALVAAIAAAYYIDSRIQVQLYEPTLHRSMYLFNAVLSMGLVASAFARLRSRKRAVAWGAMIIFVASLGFTFYHAGRNQNVKTQMFYRGTQARHNLQLLWWIFDFDRDGYSALLDGGDSDDRRADINPGLLETPGDRIDNNCVGGELTQEGIREWRAEHTVKAAAQTSARRFNVVYFFIDTVRADHLSVYGYHRKTTPNLERLAAQSIVFENGFSPAARTSEAIPRFMQSSYWDGHYESWTEALARNGYDVKLFPGRRAWDRYEKMMRPAKGAQRRPLAENIDFAIETLSRQPDRRPFCAFVYVPDPHRPYVRHQEFDYGESIVDLYDGELAYTDHHLGRFFDWMEKAGRFEDTIVVIMSDHGESLGERDVYFHSSQLYNEQVHVPMIVHVPGIAARRIADYVSTIDLGPTLMEASGLPRSSDYLGVSLLPLARGEEFVRPPIYAEQTSQDVSQYVRFDQQIHPERKKYMVITQDGFKMIYNRDAYSFELFDLKNDPREERNLYDRMAEKAALMRKLIGRYVDMVTASRPWDADEGRFSRAGGTDGDKVED
jgi:arylsulfatase A-like enzyme